MFLNYQIIQSLVNKSLSSVTLMFQKITTLVNYVLVLNNQLLFNLNLNFFVWKTTNYATSNWFMYDRKVNKTYGYTFK